MVDSVSWGTLGETGLPMCPLKTAVMEAVAAGRQRILLTLATGYLELAKTEASLAVLRDGLRISEDYAGQVLRAMEVGVAYKGEVLRAKLQTRKNQLQIRRADEERRLTVETAGELLRLSRDRQEFNVGAVLEAVQAEADLTQARLEYLVLLASHNQAQFALSRATGEDTTAGLR